MAVKQRFCKTRSDKKTWKISMMNILLCLFMPAGNDSVQMRYNTEDKNFRNRWHHEILISLQAITDLSCLS